jgi:hypothetical protein
MNDTFSMRTLFFFVNFYENSLPSMLKEQKQPIDILKKYLIINNDFT